METEKNDQADLGGTAKEFSSIKCREKEKKKKSNFPRLPLSAR